MSRPFQFKLPPYDGVEGRCLTPEQRVAVNLDSAIFSGVPGTGKTTVAIWRIKRGKDNILFTYTRLLSAAISALSSNESGIWGAHQWYFAKCNRALLNDDIRDGSVLTTLNRFNVKLKNVIIDEGQDLEMAFFKALVSVSDKVSVGADEAQQLYEVDTTMKSLEGALQKTKHILTRNFRNRYKIYNFARQFIPNNPQVNDPSLLERLKEERAGGTVEVHIKNSQNDLDEVISQIIKARNDGNIGILLSKTSDVDYYSKYLDGNEIEHSAYHSRIHFRKKRNTERNLKNILITTFKSAKGLEFDTVIMPKLENSNDDNNEFYVGATRAKTYLYLLSANGLPSVLNEFKTDTYTTKSEAETINISSEDDDALPF